MKAVTHSDKGLEYMSLLRLTRLDRLKLEEYVLSPVYYAKIAKRLEAGQDEQEAHLEELKGGLAKL